MGQGDPGGQPQGGVRSMPFGRHSTFPLRTRRSSAAVPSGNARPFQMEGIMKLPRRQFLHLAAGAAVLPFASSIAGAQTYPSRPIMIVVGAAAGGATDVIARMMAERMKSSLGQP